MTQIPSLLDLFKSGVQFGHLVSKRYPKMKPYIFSVKNGIHIINLEETQKKLAEALAFVTDLVAGGGTILFLGTKQQAQPIIAKYATDCGMPYVKERWLGGTFTNFVEIVRVIQRFQELKRKRQSGELEKYTKKERLEFDLEIGRLDRIVGGIEQLKKIPDALFVIDVKREHIAIAEAQRKKVPIVALCDTNVNPTPIQYVIPGNDDAIKSVELVTRLVSEAVAEGLARRQAAGQAALSKTAVPAEAVERVGAEVAATAELTPKDVGR